MQFDKDKPAPGIEARTLDDRIRENNDGLEDAISRDHKFPTGYSVDAGEHLQVTFNAPLGTKPTVSGTKGALYTKTYNGHAEPFFEDENGNEFLVMVPVGTILPFIPGYFTNGSNSGYTFQLGTANTVAAINALLNDYGWYVCNGAALNDSDSPIFNGSGRYLPNLYDDRFLMGDTVAGGIGGSSTMAHIHAGPSHTHTTGNHTLTINEIPSHWHYTSNYDGSGDDGATAPTAANPHGDSNWKNWNNPGYSSNTGGGAAHNHGFTGSSGTGNTGAASNDENRPKYLSCFYIMRVH